MSTTFQTQPDSVEPASSAQVKQAKAQYAASLLTEVLAAPARAATELVYAAISAPAACMHMSTAVSDADHQIMRIKRLMGADPGWAGPGSLAPNPESIKAVIQVINRLKSLPVPCPVASIGSHGNAGLSWSDANFYADVEFFDDGRVGYLLQVKGQDSLDDEEDAPETGIPSALGRALTTAYLSNKP